MKQKQGAVVSTSVGAYAERLNLKSEVFIRQARPLLYPRAETDRYYRQHHTICHASVGLLSRRNGKDLRVR